VAWEQPVRHRHHGISREDPWHWLRERDNPKVIAHLEAENAYTASVMAPVQPLVEQLSRELLSRIEESNRSAPYPDGRYIYQSRIEKGENYRRYYRRPRSGEGEWVLYLDANKEAQSTAYFDLGFLDVSPDGNTLAYAIDTTGDESYTLRFRDLESGKDLPQQIEAVSPDGEWDASGTVYYYLLEDEARRPFRIMRYRLGDDPASATEVYHEADVQFFAGLYKSQDQGYLFAYSESQETTEVHFLDAADTGGAFTRLFPRRPFVQYWVEHQDGHWLVRTNENAPDFQLLSLPVGQSDLAGAAVLVPPREGVRLTDVQPLRHHLLLFERTNGLDRVRARDLRDGNEHCIEMPDTVYDLSPAVNAEYDTVFFDFSYSSPIRPSLTVRYNLDTRSREIIRETSVPSGHDPADYTAYRVEALSHDGVHVPMTILHRRDLAMDGSNPAYMYGYGAYGSSVEAHFRTSWLTWLQRGFVVAIAHVRGGGLLGEHWYQEGKLHKKENTFEDFIACAETLISSGYTRERRIVIEGGSAGGLLIGAVLNRRPDLFKAAVASVPFVDVINTMFDPSLPLTTFEYEEWGNPSEKAVFETLMSYSPYDNVHHADYPALLVTAGFNDPRVPYWEAAKWVAKLRKHQTGSAPILLKTNLETGHMGASGRYDAWKETAFEQAFLLSCLP
jgi:oligopeptidase B